MKRWGPGPRADAGRGAVARLVADGGARGELGHRWPGRAAGEGDTGGMSHPAPAASPADPKPPTPKGEGGGGEGLATVLIALGVNTAVALVKSVVAALTGSAAMVAEAFHSWADAGNEVFLLLAERRAGRVADARHPVGYGRAAYVWSMIAAFGLFAVGSAVSVWHGITAWGADEAESSYTLAYIVLGAAFVLEAVSFVNAHRCIYQDANRWIRKPTPVITPNRVRDRPSRCRPKRGAKSPI